MATRNDTKNKSVTDALDLLIADHKAVQQLFKKFETLKDGDDDDAKGALVTEICTQLTVHAQIEEEIFYPAVRDAIDDEDIMDEAEVEHAGAKDLIAQLQDAKPGDELYDAKVTVLGENVNHHVKEEQDEMFPKVKKAKVDTASLGEQLAARKQELLGGMQGGSPAKGKASAPVKKAAKATKRG